MERDLLNQAATVASPSIAGQLKGQIREVGRKKDGNSHKADAPIKNYNSATPFGIGRFVLGRAGKSRQLPHIKRRFYNAEKNGALCPNFRRALAPLSDHRQRRAVPMESFQVEPVSTDHIGRTGGLQKPLTLQAP
jgi:hypothetical protein